MPSISKLSPQARAARAQRLARLKKKWVREQPERARKVQEQWNLVLRELGKQPEWVHLQSHGRWDGVWQERQGQVQQEQTRKLSPTQKNIILTLLSRFLQERACIEEWVGDLCEMRGQWQKQGLTPWGINLRTLGVALHLLFAQGRCMVYDRVFARSWRKPL
jgi:hypothetical protein